MGWHRTIYCAAAIVCLLPGAIRADDGPKRLLLIGQGPDGHKAATHEYMAGQRVLAACLKDVAGLEVSVVRADGAWPEGPELIANADGAVLFVSEGARWMLEDPRRAQAFARLAGRKGGLATIHWAMGTRAAENIDGYLKLFGGCHGGPDRRYKVVETNVQVVDRKHPITRAINNFDVHEEFYFRLKFVKPEGSVTPLLRARIEDRAETVCWSWQRPDGGRSFGFSGMHFHENWRREDYRRLIAQGVLWTLGMKIPADGLNVDVHPRVFALKPAAPGR